MLTSLIVGLILRIPGEVSFYLFLTLCYNLWWQAPRVNYLLDHFILYIDHFILYISFTFIYFMYVEGGSIEQLVGLLYVVVFFFFFKSSFIHLLMFLCSSWKLVYYLVDVRLLICSKHTSSVDLGKPVDIIFFRLQQSL